MKKKVDKKSINMIDVLSCKISLFIRVTTTGMRIKWYKRDSRTFFFLPQHTLIFPHSSHSFRCIAKSQVRPKEHWTRLNWPTFQSTRSKCNFLTSLIFWMIKAVQKIIQKPYLFHWKNFEMHLKPPVPAFFLFFMWINMFVKFAFAYYSFLILLPHFLRADVVDASEKLTYIHF